ncbi:MAG: hypothetical protein J6S52_03875, partial [Prevotella sp.]|nr:hypothetical protein [Prevotella sp.]
LVHEHAVSCLAALFIEVLILVSQPIKDVNILLLFLYFLQTIVRKAPEANGRNKFLANYK